ncbi:hypothetical protein C2S52_014892, partial [Perilla frutescens var. hirtella]
ANHCYVPLDSDVSIQLDIQENLSSDSSHLKEKLKEPSLLKLKKKVRFNLNVKAYEPIPDYDDVSIYLSDGEEETKFHTETTSAGDLHYEEDNAIASSITSYPASYRYQNCRDSDDEEDHQDLKLDLEEPDETEGSDQEIDDVSSNQSDDGLPGEEDFAWVLDPFLVKSDTDVTKNQVPKQEKTSLESKPLNARDRSRYVSSVLNPVENLSQWKVIKAKATAPQLKLQKENLMSKQDGNSPSSTKTYPASMKMRNLNASDCPGHAIAADASLSNWLSSFGTRPVTKSSSSGQ